MRVPSLTVLQTSEEYFGVQLFAFCKFQYALK
ncbi:hypothetical protein vBEcoMWL3_gp083 [Escherichia phage vB_EcoM_WL-3]|nr:hypothetical protein vBEcoMWL3_gp083 [Escherichia phage vB_EcoM_WL-3]